MPLGIAGDPSFGSSVSARDIASEARSTRSETRDCPYAVLPHSIQESSKVYHIEGFGRNVGYVVGARPNDVACVMHFLTVAMQNRLLAE